MIENIWGHCSLVLASILFSVAVIEDTTKRTIVGFALGLLLLVGGLVLVA